MRMSNYIRSILENANIRLNDNIIAQVAETADIHYVNDIEIENLISFDEVRGFTFNNAPIASIKKLTPSDDFYPDPKKEIPPSWTTEDYNHYILTTISESSISNIDGLCISGTQQLRNDYFVKCLKIIGYSIEEINIEEIEIIVHTENFQIYDNNKEDDKSSIIVLQIRTDDAAADFSKTMDNIKKSLYQKLTDILGTLGEGSIEYIERILADASVTLRRQVDNYNNIDTPMISIIK